MGDEIDSLVKDCSDALRECHSLLGEVIGLWESGGKIHIGTAEQAAYLKAKISELFT